MQASVTYQFLPNESTDHPFALKISQATFSRGPILLLHVDAGFSVTT